MNSDTAALREGDVVVDVHGLVEAATSITPYFHAIAGMPIDDDGKRPISFGRDETEEGNLDLDVQFRASRGVVEFRFIGSIVYEGYQLVADVAVRTEIPQNVRPTHASIDEYGARVAMFSAFPYIREGISSLVGRFGLEPMTLPILRQPEEFSSDEENADEPFPLGDDAD